MTEPAGLDPLTAADLRRLAKRERETQKKCRQRASQAMERAKAALAPNPDGYVIPPMPAGFTAQRRWLRDGHDAYSHRMISLLELTEMRRSVSTQAETYKAGAVVRQSFAAERSAAAQERMAEVLASVEHGGAAVMLLSLVFARALREHLAEGLARGQLETVLSGARCLEALAVLAGPTTAAQAFKAACQES